MMGKGCKSDAPLTGLETLRGVVWMAGNGFAYSPRLGAWTRRSGNVSVSVMFPTPAWNVTALVRRPCGRTARGTSSRETKDVAAAVDMAIMRTGEAGQ